jgi:hypothetical protein
LIVELGFFSVLVSRLRAAAGALFPPEGEEKKSEFEAERHRSEAYQRRASTDGRPRGSGMISPVRTVLITLIGPERTTDLVVDADTMVEELLPSLLAAGGVAESDPEQPAWGLALMGKQPIATEDSTAVCYAPGAGR